MDNDINSNISKNIETILQHLTKLYFDHKYEDICKILKIEHNSNYNNNEPVYKYNKNEGMIFYKNENPIIYTRVYVDKEAKYILKTLLMVTFNSVDEKNIIYLIINKWLKNVHLTGFLEQESIPKIIGKESYIQLKVSKKCWDDMSKACKNKGVSIKIGFKMAIINYFNELLQEKN